MDDATYDLTIELCTNSLLESIFGELAEVVDAQKTKTETLTR